jgi:outer membrane receptor protein involved in Fe transport
MSLARYELTDNIELYGRANYSRIKVDTQLAPTATAGFSFNLDPTNPFLSAAERAAFFDTVANPALKINNGSKPGARAGTSTIGIRRRMVETGGRLENNDTRNQQYVAGLRGDLGSLKWDIFAQYGQSKKHRVLRNDLSYTALQQALDVVAGPGGVPQCFDPSNGCVPLNLFNVGIIPQSALAFVLRNALEDTKTSEFVTGASIGGDLGFLKSPFALHPAAFSAGVEYRREKGSTVVDSNYASGDLIYYGQGQNISGKYDVKEVFAEIKLPLVEDRPGFYRLGLEAGGRYSDYSTVGGVKTYKIGGDYAPVEGVRFRSIYQRAVRAPSLYELFSPLVAATGGLNVDPCQGAISGAVVTECLREGAPLSSIGNIPEPVSGQINIFYGGNPNLRAEKSDTFTAGVVLNPKSLRGFSASIDYYHIKIAGAIAATPPSVILANCFASPGASNPFCNGIVRNPLDGSLSGDTTIGVPAGLGNVGAIGTSGIDFAMTYSGGNRRAFNYSVAFNGTYLKSYTFKPSPDADTNHCAGTFGPLCDYEPQPKWRHVVDVRLGFHPVSFTTRWRFSGATHADPTIGPDASLVQRIKPYNYFDETVGFDITDRFTFRLGVLNLFDKKPPIVGDTLGTTHTGGGTFPNSFDVIGRSYFAGVTAKF